MRSKEFEHGTKEWDAFVRFGDEFEDAEFKSITDKATDVDEMAYSHTRMAKKQAPNVVIYVARADYDQVSKNAYDGIIRQIERDSIGSRKLTRVYLLKPNGTQMRVMK